MVEKVLKLLQRKERWLVVAGVRFLRTCIGTKVRQLPVLTRSHCCCYHVLPAGHTAQQVGQQHTSRPCSSRQFGQHPS